MDFRETLIVIGGIVLCFLIVFGAATFIDVYTATMKEECRLAAIEQAYTAVEIQAICDRK